METASSLVEYLKLVLKEWESILAIVSFFLYVAVFYFPKIKKFIEWVPKGVILTGATLLLFWATFQVWQAESYKPTLAANVEVTHFGYAPNEPATYLSTLVAISNIDIVKNTPSDFLLRWHKSDNEFQDFNPVHSLNEVQMFSENGQTITYKPEEMIYEKTLSGIEPGSTARGWLRFVLQNVHPNQLVNGKIDIIFNDIYGAAYNSSVNIDGKDSAEPYYPGVKPISQ